MKPFTGIRKINGEETEFIIYLDPSRKYGYLTDFFQNKNRLDAFIYDDKCVIDGITYDYHFKKSDDELLFVAKECVNIYDLKYFLNCYYGSNFMLASDRVSV
jgi:hypothetical protein